MKTDDPIKKAQEVMKLIPHRYPFLLLDRILSYDSDNLVAIKSVSINEPFFQGHFPDRPIMPGVLIVEAMAQAASCLVVLENENKNSENLSVFLMKIDKARFRKPITPGDQIRIEVQKEKSRGDIWQFYGKSFVEDQLACESSFAAMVVRLDDDKK
jgi:beta-hydroxyacyl-[acyl carrier protein] dehydratase FabZ